MTNGYFILLQLCLALITIFFFSIAIYKALYKGFGGFAADVVAAIDQVPVLFYSYVWKF